MKPTAAKVLHVLPVDLPRGAQRYAKALRDTLDSPDVTHRTLAIFESSTLALDADIKLGVSRSGLARLGFEPLATLSLRATLSSERPDVVVAHGSEPLKYLLPLVGRALPLVYYKIGVVGPQAHRGARRWLHARMLARPQRIAGVSQECLDEAERLFDVPRAKLVLIANGRDPEQFQPRAPSTTPAGPPRLIYVGHFAPTKRPAWFLEVVKLLRQAGVAFTASMVGDGPLLQPLRAAARAADVELLGHRDDVASLLRQHDVLAFTSEPSGEGMPGVFIEAGLSGLPVVTTDVAGARTVIEDGRSGYVVAHGDLAGFAKRARELLSVPELRSSMGHAARARCVSHFTLRASTERWQRLLEELLARQPSPAAW
ncbi:MAG TPA: glycosyltransferase family 4 protein [Polyangiaceae bacterium]|nr:glycosyltransferase family 4 protein [Polyangiaceae bacterium]